MVYVALLRGINVGGKARVEMPRLKAVFEKLGFSNVTTYINSGNVVFSNGNVAAVDLAIGIEVAIENEFGFKVPVVVRDQSNIAALTKAIPSTWTNDSSMKTDVLFLWSGHDKREVLDGLAINPKIEDVLYLPGAVVWRVDRAHVSKSGLLKIVGTPLYKNMTARNINTVRKLASLMGAPAA